MKKSRRTFTATIARSLPYAVLARGSLFLESTSVRKDTENMSNPGDLASYGDGRDDATSAIQALIDASTSEGIPAIIPSGKYLVDADKGIFLRTNTRLVLGSHVQIVAKPSRNNRYGIIKIYDVDNVNVSGGTITGERYFHLGKGGEWGMGLDIEGSSNVTISDLTVEKCWGDGIYIGAGHQRHSPCRNIILHNVTSAGNRRQGLSVVACIGANIIDCRFLYTKGTPPACGIDLEPNENDAVTHIVIKNCEINGNAGSGIQTWNHVAGFEVIGCAIFENMSHGLLLGGVTSDVKISGNRMFGNKKSNVFIGKNANQYEIIDNIFCNPKNPT